MSLSMLESESDVLVPPTGDWLRDRVYDNPFLADRRALFERWLQDPTPREEIAERSGVSLGELLRSFNHTAPLSAPVPFAYRGVPFTVVAMEGVCDDIADGRFPLFGSPVTLRCYLGDPELLPQEMVEAADWNYMDAGRPGFLGYAYGVHYEGTLYLAGMQSDIAVRYAYLFQGRGETTDIRRGDEVVSGSAADLAARFGDHVPVLRRTFQRYWISVLLGASAAWARLRGDVTRLGLLQFPLTDEEDRRGTVVHRVYRELPERLGSPRRRVVVDGTSHSYAVAGFDEVVAHLGDRLRLAGDF
ncbi:hypothetical protein FHR81_000992 [Actinoalloteichus hoggarensis]|uniref:Uncharacterized protein n=1 Tax=Actinoalloteichus hoggarensis TaxID=1470176 RepID=A0A221VYX9_9PSEU|nr:hypothetical protein [Actinoalloteichus hoggarensis]ASO18729.1 hypothetical protein AHOG_05380 [Actinoalloteichus hoggarensis]MBB5919962.1 hypothetical protein [Actinoalloteichus hoggarensis]